MESTPAVLVCMCGLREVTAIFHMSIYYINNPKATMYLFLHSNQYSELQIRGTIVPLMAK